MRELNYHRNAVRRYAWLLTATLPIPFRLPRPRRRGGLTAGTIPLDGMHGGA